MSPNEPPSPASGPTGPELDALRAELERERHRAEELEAKNRAIEAGRRDSSEAPAGARRRTHRFWVALLLVLGTVLTPITIVALYVNAEVTDTDRYVQTVEPLASDAAIQAYVADRVSSELFSEVDIENYVSDALPDRAQPLVGPLTSALRGFVREATGRVLESERFQQLWVSANRTAHAQLVNVLTGDDDGAVRATDNGAVVVDLSDVSREVQQRLDETGIDLFSRIPLDRLGGDITVFRSEDLYKARKAVGLLETIAFGLPFVVIGCFGGAVFLSANRRRGFVKAAVCFTLGAAILAVGLSIARGLYLDAATGRGGVPYDAAAAVFDTLVRLLRVSIRAVLTFSIIVVLIVFFSGPSRLAAGFRAAVGRAVAWAGRQAQEAGWQWLNPIHFVTRHKWGLRVGVAVVAFVLVFQWDRPTPLVIVTLALLSLVVLALIEFFGRDEPGLPTTPAAP
jgi:hypothetical protein